MTMRQIEAPNAPTNANTQRSRILRLLSEAAGQWVSLPSIAACAAQYNARIFELRRSGFNIENRTKEVDGVRHSWFRLGKGQSVTSNGPHESTPESVTSETPSLFSKGGR